MLYNPPIAALSTVTPITEWLGAGTRTRGQGGRSRLGRRDPLLLLVFPGIAQIRALSYNPMTVAKSGTERSFKDQGDPSRGSRLKHSDTPRTAPILGAEPPTPQVIIVEGDSALAEMLEYSVANAGRPSRTFRRGDAAIDYLLGELPGDLSPVVLLDLDLLGSEGFLALQRIVEACPKASVMVLSAQGAERDQIRALRAGAVDYLVKPISIPILIAKVERRLADR